MISISIEYSYPVKILVLSASITAHKYSITALRPIKNHHGCNERLIKLKVKFIQNFVAFDLVYIDLYAHNTSDFVVCTQKVQKILIV